MKSRKITNWGKEMATAVKWIGRDTVKSRIKKSKWNLKHQMHCHTKAAHLRPKWKMVWRNGALKAHCFIPFVFIQNFFQQFFHLVVRNEDDSFSFTNIQTLSLYLLTRIFDCSFHDSNQLNWSKQNNSIQTLTPSEPLLLHITRQASKRIMDTFIIASNHLVNICARCYSVQCRHKCQRNDKHPMPLTNTSKTTLNTIIGAIETANDNDGPALSFQTNQRNRRQIANKH